MADTSFYTEDICTLASSPGTKIGIVERTTNDIDTHLPHPERQYDNLICHKDIPKPQFDRFKKTGIPPLDSVLVEWKNDRRANAQLIPTRLLKLVDRALLVGDIVKGGVTDSMSGTVVETMVTCTLYPSATSRIKFEEGEGGSQSENGGASEGGTVGYDIQEADLLLDIPAHEIRSANDFEEGSMIIYHDWVGRIEDVFDEVTVRLSNGSIVQVENADELRPLHKPEGDRHEVGDIVKTKQGNLKRGEWIVGTFDTAVTPVGDVIGVRVSKVQVAWLCRRLYGPAGADSHIEPPGHLSAATLNSGQVHIYDRSLSPSKDTASAIGRCVDFIVGTGVRFKDLAGAAMKYDGTKSINESGHKNHVKKVPQSATSGFDLNVYMIMSLKTKATVLWQDCTTTTEDSTQLIPDINLEDESEVWPGEIVVSQEAATVPGHDWILEYRKVGVVQSVSAADRLATVLWLPDAKIQYHNIADVDEYMSPALLPGSTLGLPAAPPTKSTINKPPNAVLEDVTLYDIRAADGINKRRGDFVILHPPDEAGLNASRQLDWIGEVVDLGNDGYLTVRLGACNPVKDVKVSPEYATIVYSTDMPSAPGEDGYDNEFDSGDDGESLSGSNETGYRTEDEEVWELPDGVPVSMEDGEWSTADEDSDEEMPLDLGAHGLVKVLTDKMIDDNVKRRQRDFQEGYAEPMEGVEETSTPAAERSQPTLHEHQNESTIPDSGVSLPQTAQESPIHSRTAASPPPFAVLESEPPDSTPYLTPPPPPLTTSLMKRIGKEHRILSSSLPDGIFVRTWESRLDLLRVLIIGPLDTPYEFAPFIIDLNIPPEYPHSPPLAYFYSWTKGQGPVNPNLYENGKICLSLLGTWHADEKGENWSPSRSTILQVLVSIMGLVLVKEPYYNEAGFEVRAGLADAAVPSQLYSERTYFRSRGFITHALTNEIGGFADVIQWVYVSEEGEAPRLLDKAVEAAREILEKGMEGRGVVGRGGLSRMSKGALVMLGREVKALEEVRGSLSVGRS
ncbi:hypothetical protein EJ08DRAFT_688371 [Tothia fuscella]|uniref:UBC core domain-containing protein n=1 Tax=Tothia fuscella TaxID=1048955 RepID=A0A9P4NP12_9PEZI|nr:hypothetical protein EJ08DRAFT_688371 [Tothia fuscella]